MSASSSAFSSCFFASSPMIVWCISTWLSTLPSEYFVSSRVAASSTASLMAMPSEPGEFGILLEHLLAGLGVGARAGHDLGAPGLHHDAAVRLLLVRDLDHVDLALQAEHLAGQRQRGAPLAGAGLRAEARDLLLLVVVGLRDGGVGLVAAGRAHALVLVVDARRRAERLLEPPRAEERARAATADRRRGPRRGSRSSARWLTSCLISSIGNSGARSAGRSAARCPGAGRAAPASSGRPGCCTTWSGCPSRRGELRAVAVDLGCHTGLLREFAEAVSPAVEKWRQP